MENQCEILKMADKRKTLVEYFNANKLYYIVNNFHIFKSQKKWKKNHNIINPYTILTNYLAKSINGSIYVDYIQKNGIGRFYAKKSLSLQCIPRQIRHTISKDIYIDIDMINAHPVILSYLCEKSNFDCPILDQYILNRDNLLSQIKDSNNETVDRDMAKQIYLSIMNGGSKDYLNIPDPPDHLIKFKQEVSKIHHHFIEKNKKDFEMYRLKNINEKKKYFNHEGSYVNSLMNNFENKILHEMYNFFGKPKDAVLCFDGIMLRKGKKYDIKKCEHFIESIYPNLNLKLKIKKMNDELIFPQDAFIPKYPDLELNYFMDYVNLIKHMKKNGDIHENWVHQWISNSIVLIQNAGDPFFMTKNKMIDQSTKEVSIYYKPIKCAKVIQSLKIRVYLYNQYYCEKTAKESKTWKKQPKKGEIKYLKIHKIIITKISSILCDMLENSDLPTFNGCEFYPYLKQKNGIPQLYEKFNTFTGFPMENIHEEYNIKFEDTLIYKHLKEIMFNNHDGELNHFLDHLADIIQDPANIKPNAHLFYSKQGTGKGLMAEWFKKLIGTNNTATIINLDRYFGSNFNVHTSNKLLKIFEEVSNKGHAYNQYNRLKGEISSPVENIEPKGIDSWSVRNCARMWFFTNNEMSLYIEGDDRRYTLHKVCNDKANNSEYFKPIWEEISKTEYLKCAFDFLANRQYDPDSARNCYDTPYKKSQKLANLPKGIKFIKHFIETKCDKQNTNKPTYVGFSYFKELYKSWCESNGTKYNVSTLKTQLKQIGLEDPKRRKLEGRRILFINIVPSLVQKNIGSAIKSSDFKFDWGDEKLYAFENIITCPEYD